MVLFTMQLIRASILGFALFQNPVSAVVITQRDAIITDDAYVPLFILRYSKHVEARFRHIF